MSLFLLFGLLLFLQHAGHAEAGEEPVIEMEPFNGELSAIVGETASLLCKVTQGEPRPTVRWVKGPDNTPVGGEGEELSFDPVKLEDDSGYKCTASNSAGIKIGEFTITVYEYENRTVSFGESQMIANPHGTNGIKLTWYNTKLMAGDSVDDEYKVAEWLVSGSSDNVKPGYDVDNKTGDLLIPSVTLDHEGWYTAFLMDPMIENKYSYKYFTVYVQPSEVVLEGLPNPVNESVEQTLTCTVPKVRPENVMFSWSISESVIVGSEQESTKNGDTFEVISTLNYTFLRGMDRKTLKCAVGFALFPKDWISAARNINMIYPYSVRTEQVNGTALPIRGHDLPLKCTTDKVGKPTSTDYSWYKEEDKHPLIDDDKYTGTQTLEMTIKTLVEEKDAGVYKCRLRNDAGFSQTEGYHLKVLYKPTVKIECPKAVNENEKLVVNCTVTEAEPAVKEDAINWYYNDTIRDDTGEQLEVENIARDQNGKYSCQALNKVDKSNRDECSIDVYYNYKVRTEQVDGAALPVRGEDMSLICSTVDEGNPLSTDYSWYKDEDKQPLIDGDKYTGTQTQKMTIETLEVQDAGLYQCRLRNDAGSSVTEGYNLKKVLYEPSVKIECPQAVNETETLVVSCNITEAEPAVEEEHIIWYYNEEPMNNRGKLLEVKNITRLQKGKYSCDASNIVGTSIRANCIIDIYYGPAGKPSVEINVPIIAVTQEVKLTCHTGDVTDWGNPTSEHYIWEKDGQKIAIHNKTYTFTPDKITESGNFSCALTNHYGQTKLSSPANLIVEAPVMIEDEPSEWMFEPLYNDSSFLIQYNVSGTSKMDFCLTNFTKDVPETAFTLKINTIDGDFHYGQKEAQHVSWSWNLLDEYTSCSNMTFFNGNYTFEADGTIVDRPSKESRTFTINVQYPAIWKFPERRESSALGQPKTLYCDVCAEPPPTEYMWSFMGNISMNVTGPHLNISNVTSEDIGWYTCTVVNVIKKVEYQKTFNITLEEKGSPHSPTVFKVISWTARTLLVTWGVGFDGGYDLELFELVYINATGGESMTKIIDCIENTICEHRIQNLEPNSTYTLKVRAKNKRKDGVAYSDYKETKGTTKFLPQVNMLTPEITETYIHVKWEYKNAYHNQRQFDDDVGIVVHYKKENEENFKRFPVNKNSKIPAANQSAKIYGEFDTSPLYNFIYEIYEGDEKSNQHSIDLPPPNTSEHGGTDPGIIAGAVIGGIVFLILVSFFVILWIRRGKVKRPGEAHTGMDGSGNGAPLNQELIHETVFGPSEPQYEEVAKPGDRSSKPDIAPKPKPRKGNTDSTHSAKSGVANGGFDNETTDYVNVGPVKKGTENDREAAPNTEAHGGGKQKQKPKPAKRPKPSKDKRGTSSQPQPDTNPSEELIYADLGFDNDKNDKKEKKKKAAPEKGPEEIIGAENMTDYADLDFEQMKTPDRSPPAEPEQPLPSEPMYANMENDGSLV